MKDVIEAAIKVLVAKLTSDTKPDEALKFTQAALNLAHVQATFVGSAHLEKQ